MTALLRVAARAVAVAADRALRTDPPLAYGRACPGCARSLDFNCREISSDGDLQYVQCASCGTRSTWLWDDEGPTLVAREVRSAA